jgi:hypothetical protein
MFLFCSPSRSRSKSIIQGRRAKERKNGRRKENIERKEGVVVLATKATK